MTTESDFDKIYSRTVKPSYSRLCELWGEHAEEWLLKMAAFDEGLTIWSSFDQLSPEEQFAFWAWTRENKEGLK